MFQQPMTEITNYLTQQPIIADKEVSRNLVNNYLENYINHSYPPSGLREFINSQLNIPGFEEMCENGTLANSGIFKGVDKEVSYKVIDKVQGTTLLSTGDQHLIVDNQVWHHFPSDKSNKKTVVDQHISSGEDGQNYKNIGLLRRLIKSRI
jgi:hypothetical protein